MKLRNVLGAVVALTCATALMGSSAFAAGEEIVIETSPFSPANPTQWIDYSVANTQAAWLLNSVTCLKLLDYDEETGALVPEAAEAMPTVSPDGKTYTFTVRPGQWLQGSPSEPVTAESFKRAIERATSPFMAANLGSTPLPARPFVAGIEGSNDFYNGVGPFSGIQASGNVLTIQLSNPDPTFAKRISMPYFCGTRSDAPAGFVSGTPPHSGGPYFVAGTYAGGSGPTLEHTILLIPNGSYTGSRLQNLGTIRFVQHGHVDPEDYVLAAPAAYTPPAGVQIPPPTITSSVQIMALNTSRAPFDSMQMRRAASDAVNRIALSAVLGWQPTDQFVSPLLEGFEDVDAWPLAGNPAGAIANLAGATPAVTFCHDNSRAAVAALAETQLEAVGFQVTLVNPTQAPIFQSYFPYIGNPNNCDIAVGSFGPSYPDPSSILTSLFYGPTNPSFYNDPAFNARFGAASTMTPESARLHEYAGIDASAADMVLAIAMGYNVRRDAFADRIGCRIANNVLVGYAVNRLCIEVAETADPGGTISTGGDATPASPLQTSVTVPSGGDVTITQAQSDASELPAFKLLEQELDITAPAQDATNPLVLRFEIDATALANAPLSIDAVVVYRNGTPVSDCLDPGGTSADPDPCVASRTPEADGDGVIVVRTSQASTWNFGGYGIVSGPFQPVDAQPTLNTVKAGQAVPVKFSLGGDYGLDVLADGYPKSVGGTCSGGPTDAIETTSNGSGLSYASSGQYTYHWKTSKQWSGHCRTLILQFSDGQELTADFKFK